jgi:hypothetical protein
MENPRLNEFHLNLIYHFTFPLGKEKVKNFSENPGIFVRRFSRLKN